MSNAIMQGNPYAFQSAGHIPPQMEYVDALMALAFEQRTANLIAFLEGQREAYRDGMLNDAGIDLTVVVANQIAERLGLNV